MRAYSGEQGRLAASKALVRVAHVHRIQCVRLVEVVDVQLANEALEVRMFEVQREHFLCENILLLDDDHFPIHAPTQEQVN